MVCLENRYYKFSLHWTSCHSRCSCCGRYVLDWVLGHRNIGILQALHLGVMFDSARISLSVTYAITLAGMFQYGVRLSTEVENIVRRYTEL